MLQSFMSNVSVVERGADTKMRGTNTQSVGETLGQEEEKDDSTEKLSNVVGSSKQWWDKLTRSSEDKVGILEVSLN